MTTYYLYVKTHSTTGLKYLGQTRAANPHKYPGSGKRWKHHLKKHGKNISTKILLVTEDKEELKETGVFFSKLWNIVESNEWANLKDEEGDGGFGAINENREYYNSIVSKALKGVPKSEAHKNAMRKGHDNDETRLLHSIATKNTRAAQTPERRSEIAALGGAGNKGKTQSFEHKMNRANAIRKTYRHGDRIVTNAKEYCINNDYNYVSFTQAAKYNRIYDNKPTEIVDAY
jgi:general stress protein YciG